MNIFGVCGVGLFDGQVTLVQAYTVIEDQNSACFTFWLFGTVAQYVILKERLSNSECSESKMVQIY